MGPYTTRSAVMGFRRFTGRAFLNTRTGKWKKRSVGKWNISLYIIRMLAGGAEDGSPFLEYPRRKPRKNGIVVLTEAGRDHLDRLSLHR